MNLSLNEVHIWSGSLAITPEQEADYRLILTPDEIDRADRYKFPRDRRRFITARALLRNILSKYINMLPIDMLFKLGEHGKPYLDMPDVPIEFNVSHSDELAVFAFDLTYPLGIDVEKMQINFPKNVMHKYFTEKERDTVLALPLSEQYKSFYRFWASKEALIKATGNGLFNSASNISLSIQNDAEIIQFENAAWALKRLDIDPDYQTMLACHPSIKALSHFTYQHV